MTAQAVEPGRLLAGRYRVEDLLDEVGAVRSWRAVDEVLRRAVFVLTVPTEDNHATAITKAARGASHVGDTRFLQILDVDSMDGVAYFVREWMPGQNLTTLLASGPLDAEQAAALGREVAEALASAHRQGVSHLRLEPSSVIIAPNGSVKISGLGTEAALRGLEERDPGAADAAGVGRILYAALTGRWPGDAEHGLPVAVRIEGRFASPRQVRPGVPRILDEVVDRTLGNSERHHAPALTTPGDIADALSANAVTSRTNGAVLGESGEAAWPPPALLDEAPTPLRSTRAVPLAQFREAEEPDRQRTILRMVGVLVAAIFLIGAGVVGWRMLLGAVSPDDGSAAEPGPTASASDTPSPEDEGADDPVDEEEDPSDSEQEPGDLTVTLTASPTSVGASARIDLAGTIEPSEEGIALSVERSLDGENWESFPDDAGQITVSTGSNGQFGTWVQTGRTGENHWRVVGEVEGDRIESNAVTVTVG